jgi:hypothetical protein
MYVESNTEGYYPKPTQADLFNLGHDFRCFGSALLGIDARYYKDLSNLCVDLEMKTHIEEGGGGGKDDRGLQRVE